MPAVCSCLSPALGVNSDLRAQGADRAPSLLLSGLPFTCPLPLPAVQWEARAAVSQLGAIALLGRHGKVPTGSGHAGWL